MATSSPSPNSSPSAVPPASNSSLTSPPPSSASSPPPSTTTSASQPQLDSPGPSNSTTQSPSPSSASSPPPQPPSTITPASQPQLDSPASSNSTTQSPPPSAPPRTLSPPPIQSPPLKAQVHSPPPSSNVPPPASNSPSPPPSNVAPAPSLSPPPPPPANPPKNSPSPPPPTSDPPSSSPPPPPPPLSLPRPSPSKPPESPPPPPSKPPETSPPPPPSKPPETSPPPPSSKPPETSPPSPPPSANPPDSSPPPPSAIPPNSSPPPPAATPPESSPPPPAAIPPKDGPGSPPTPSPPNSPPPPISRLSPPPPSDVSPPEAFNVPSSDVPQRSNATGSGGIGTGGAVAISVVVGVVVLSLIGLTVWCMRRKRKKISGFEGYAMQSPLGSSPRSDSSFLKTHSSAPLVGSRSGSELLNSPPESVGVGNSRPWFTFEELHKATNGFSSQNLLGEGGFGSVYKGYLPDGREVAVKQLKIGGSQGEREFRAEVETISRIHHRHLVSLAGYCFSETRMLLVYEFVANDTLYSHLHGKGKPVLDWATRVKIAAGAARGIAYLHEDCHPRIIHRDIKSSNILLDGNFEARVSDFGLAKLALDANTHISTRVMGTFGYVAPEYASSGKLTDKSDVYSFGVVLLELITGRKSVDTSQPLGDESLVEWARPELSYALDNEEFNSIVDPRLENNYVQSEMFRMVEVAAACVRHSSAKRPRMGQVVRAFDSFAASDLNNGMKVGESQTFNSAQQSEEIRLFRRMAFGSQNYSTDFFSDEV